MSFLDALSEYLQGVGDAGGQRPERVVPDSIDPAFARNTLIRCLERLEQQYGDDVDLFVDSRERLFDLWQKDDAVVRFARRMVQLLRTSMGRAASNKELEDWIEVAIARQLGLKDSLPSKIRTLELDRLADLAVGTAFDVAGLVNLEIAPYASAIRATHGTVSGLGLTSIGRVFLELKGRDAIRWLLRVEVAQSFGPSDPWRVSRETARYLVDGGSWMFDDRHESEDNFPHSWKTIERLVALGLLDIRELDFGSREELEVLPVGRQLLAEIIESEESPMSVLVDSALSDLTLSAAHAVAARNRHEAVSVRVQESAVMEANARHSRLVAHEVRNILVPVKTALGALYREILLAERPGEVIARRRDGIDRGIDSIFRFIGQLVELSQFVAAPPEPFDMLAVIRDAVSTITLESGQDIEQVLPTTLPPVSGHRARVVMALANVLRNASQAVPPDTAVIRIEAEAIEGSSAVRLLVEDNGPGVPVPMRRAIFEEGVSLRGGSGLGLALVREVFEKEMRGLVACEDASLGGARFVIRVPATGVER